jgi:hypothetical protein
MLNIIIQSLNKRFRWSKSSCKPNKLNKVRVCIADADFSNGMKVPLTEFSLFDYLVCNGVTR